MGRIAWTLVVLGSLVANGYAAKKNSADDLPWLINGRHPTEHSILTAKCSLLERTRPRRARCTITQFMVSPMSDERVRERQAEIEAAASGTGAAAREAAKYLKEMCAVSKDSIPEKITGPDRAFLAAMAKACASGDKASFWDAHRTSLREVEAQTCSTMLFPPDDVEFEQIDANTWRSVTSGGICNVTLVRTLWRKPGDAAWTYRQERSVPPTADSKMCPTSSTTMEFSWRLSGRRALPCRYFD